MSLLKNDTEFKSKLQDLKAFSSGTKEKVFVMYPKAAPTTVDNFEYVPFVGSAQGQEVSSSFYPATVKGTMHCHNADGLSIFSMGDIAQAGQMATTPGVNVEDLVFTVVTKKGTVYAFQITDKEKFVAFYNQNLSSMGRITEFTEHSLSEYNISPNQTIADNEYGFMRMMNQYKVGITVFRGEDTNFNVWKKLDQKKQQDVTAINCNP